MKIASSSADDWSRFDRPASAADLLAIYRYDNVTMTAAIQRGTVFGCQFHPEKSGPALLAIIQRFLDS
ncbi:hypothetical protein ACBY01_11955 [Sphingomonas sp. ac-8]|uniref:hypothetical protein n=1 Tax=Sphingomonas sp. ac-8 TaxID=3242977 RepID=UPI003A7FE035